MNPQIYFTRIVNVNDGHKGNVFEITMARKEWHKNEYGNNDRGFWTRIVLRSNFQFVFVI